MTVRKRRNRALLIVLLLLPIGWLSYQVGWFVWAGYHLRAARRSLADRDFPAARQHLACCLRVAPTDPEYLLLAARAARRAGDLDEARRLLRACWDAKIVSEAIDLEWKLVRFQDGDLAEIDAYLQSCDTIPDAERAALIREAVIIGSLKEMDLRQAQRCLDLWAEQRSSKADRAQGLVWRGDIAIRTGDAGRAVAYYREVVEAEPRNAVARQRLAELLSRYAPQEALPHLQELLRERPTDRALRLSLARSRRSLGEQEEARQLLDELLAEAPDDFDTLLERGQVSLDLGNATEAEPWLRRALALGPSKRDANLALARCLQLAGKVAEAQPYRDRVAQIDAVLEQHAKLLLEQGRPQK